MFIRARTLVVLLGVILFAASSSSLYAGGMVTITPQFLFIDATQRSVPVNISNPSAEAVEVWFEFRYGYNANDSANNVTVLTPDSVGTDEPSAATWIRAYPSRFVLNPQESQTIRLLVEPPAGVSTGEYWARIFVVSKPMAGPTINGRSTRGTSIQLVVKTSIPMMYRVGLVNSRVKLLKNPEFTSDAKNLTIFLPLRREGNASYWGTVDCSIKDATGRQIVKQPFKVVVYKDFVLPMKIDRASLPAGDYNVSLTVRSVRADIKQSSLLQSEPQTWSLPIRIQ